MIDTLTPEQIAELEALLAKATPAPWARRNDSVCNKPIAYIDGPIHAELVAWCCASVPFREDADLIAALRNAAPALIAMAKKLGQHEIVESVAEQAWQDLIEEDDRTSPAEYPDMALIRQGELAFYMALAANMAELERDKFRAMAVRLAKAMNDDENWSSAFATILDDPKVKALLEGEK